MTPAPTNTLETVASLEGRNMENGARLPRDYATSQVLQTPNAISVHNTAVISHPTPRGLPGTNSYQVSISTKFRQGIIIDRIEVKYFWLWK